NIKGYDREEFTHMSLAKAIQNDDCDCGLGVYSVAKAFDLDFIPICDEEYDLLIRTQDLENDNIKYVLNIINSELFKEKVLNLGGYNIDEIGKIVNC
ncbi:MAG: substrate-binding domain-containing protein, partial [Peptostreptococcaceae bacterium]